MNELPQPITMLVDELATMSGVSHGQWVCNEKRLIDTAGLSGTQALFAQVPTERDELLAWLDVVADHLGVSRDETLPWAAN